MKDFLSLDEQIDLNNKVLDDLLIGYQKTQNKISILVLIYTLVSVYLIPVLTELSLSDGKLLSIIYIQSVLLFLVFFGISVYNTYKLLTPDLISYREHPRVFYRDILEQYKQKLEIDDPEILNEYVKTSYLNHIEECVERNSKLFIKKGKYYFQGFRNGLFSLLFYSICVGVIHYHKIQETKNLNKMSQEEKKPNQEKTKVNIDPKQVIIVPPKEIRENFNQTEKRVIISETKKK